MEFKTSNYQKIIEFVWLIVIISLFVLSVQIAKSDSLANQVNSFGIWAPIIFVLLKISTLVIAPLSGNPLYLIAGSLFGNYYGFLLSLLGDILGSTICFFLSRFYGHKIIKVLTGERYFKKIINMVAVLANTKSYIKARVAFLLLPDALAYASGLSKLNFLTFSLINFLFSLPTIFLFVFFGSEIIAIMARYSLLFYSLVLLISLAAFWFLIKDYGQEKLDNIRGM